MPILQFSAILRRSKVGSCRNRHLTTGQASRTTISVEHPSLTSLRCSINLQITRVQGQTATSKLLRTNGKHDQILLVGGISAVGSGTGLYLFDGEVIQKIDGLPTAGVQLAGPDHLVRLLCSDADPRSSGELLVYDGVGVERYARIPELSDLHDMIWDGESVVCTATGNNKIVWLSREGELKKTWNAPGENDAWHLNGLCHRDGKTYFSAFGIFARHREWNELEFSHRGIIYNLSEGRIEVSGLDCPHNPNLIEEGWVVCNSAHNEFLNLEYPSGILKRSVQVNGWTRGFAASDDYFFVGESANRKKLTVGASAHLCVIDRKSWEVVERFAFPVTEIAFAAFIPERFVAALRRAFRTNPYRESVNDIQNLFRNTGTDNLQLLTTTDPLPMEAFNIRIEAEVPETVTADSNFSVTVQFQNLGTGILASTPPCPVHVTSAWFQVNGNRDERVPGEGLKTRLPRPVPPRHSLRSSAAMKAPSRPGVYRLQITLVQEFVANFSEVAPSNAYTAVVKVQARGALGQVSAAITEAVKKFASG